MLVPSFKATSNLQGSGPSRCFIPKLVKIKPDHISNLMLYDPLSLEPNIDSILAGNPFL